jgi:hypothetical protein
VRVALAALLAVVLAAAGCGGGGATDAAPPAATGPGTTVATAPEPSASAAPGGRLPPAPALPSPDVPAGSVPTALTIEALGIGAAPVRPVGVEPDGEMEVPPADEVGWYRHGPAPGADGSSVLAAHVAYDGEDGVFRHLADLDAGATVAVAFADGTTRRFRVTDVARYPKSELPASLWSRRGPPALALVTCGGEFDAAAGRYEDNVVAHALPV